MVWDTIDLTVLITVVWLVSYGGFLVFTRIASWIRGE